MKGAAATAGRPPRRRTSVLDTLAKYRDLMLVALIGIVFALIVFPLPLELLDTLMALNIGLSLMVLLAVLYAPSSLSLSSFPSLLLFTTLLRLGLNIASTKQILLNAHAPQIVETFGRLVVGGNYVVGTIVFLIITVVQFIVIAKGADRAAEVSARFTLDGMPGKQMSIDADVRAGSINNNEARRRRREVDLESQLHGGLDGAMKFVKGDAIAGLVIAAITLVGGIAVGTWIRDMPIGQAASRYAVLTIGDSMVAQIPSLFLAIAAGLMIMRVSENERPTGMGAQITTQMASQPRAMILTAIFLVVCAMVPGFPTIPFLAIAALLGIPGWIATKKQGKAQLSVSAPMPAFSRDGRADAPPLVDNNLSLGAMPLLLRAPIGLITRIKSRELNTEVAKTRERLNDYLGTPFPGLRLRRVDNNGDHGITICVFDIPQAHIDYPPDFAMVAPGPDAAALNAIAVADVPAIPLPGHVWIPAAQAATVTPEMGRVVTLEQAIASLVEAAVMANAGSFLGLQETRALLQLAETEYPELSAEALKTNSIQRINEVLKRLVDERVSLRDGRNILEALVAWGVREKDTVMLTEQVRIALSRQICYRASNGTGLLRAIVLTQPSEDELRQLLQQARGAFVPFSPERAEALAGDIRGLMQRVGMQPSPPVLVTRMELRRYLRKVVEPHMPDLYVLSYDELNGAGNVEVIGEVDARSH